MFLLGLAIGFMCGGAAAFWLVWMLSGFNDGEGGKR